MEIEVRPYAAEDAQQAVDIWNEVVEAGVAFPQEDFLTAKTGHAFFMEQSYTGIACDKATGEWWGCIFCTPTTLGAAVTSATPATR